jgi:hypothetical protein
MKYLKRRLVGRTETKVKYPISENNKNLPKPDFYPEGHVETVEEFLARGGEITVVPRVKGPHEDSDDPPARLLNAVKGRYEV